MVLRTQGSRQLGGYDWNRELHNLIIQKYEEETGDDYEGDIYQELALERDIENAKRRLSKLPSTMIHVQGEDKLVAIEITRDEFEKATAYLLRQTITKCEQVLQLIELSWKDLSYVLLVGGSTKMPAITHIISDEEHFGQKPTCFGSPDLAVAQGAALQARGYIDEVTLAPLSSYGEFAQQPDIVYLTNLTQEVVKLGSILTTAHPFGTIVSNQENKCTVSHIIPAGQQYPIKMSREDYKVKPNTSTFILPVIQGGKDNRVEGEEGDYQSCISKAIYKFSGIPQREENSSIRVEFEYDRHQIIHVNAWDIETGQKLVPSKMQEELSTLETSNSMQSIVIALDCSHSMRGQELDDAKSEIGKLADQHLQPGKNIEMAIVNFGGVREIYPSTIIQDFTQNAEAIKASIRHLQASDTTPMAEGIRMSAELFQKKDQSGNNLKLIIITDGAPDVRDTALNAIEEVRSYGVDTYSIAIGSRARLDFLARIGPSLDIESSAELSKAINQLLSLG